MVEETTPNILVVDDTEAICSALRDMLTMAGYSVRTAPSGERALQIMENAAMDLVITDLRMSGMSGLDLLKKVKERSPLLPVIILTGFGDMDSVIAAMRAGVADYLKKPFSVNEVLEVVKRELKKPSLAASPQTLLAMPMEGETEPSERPPRLYIFASDDMGKIDRALTELRAQVTAESVLLLEEAGYIISAKGPFAESELPSLTTLIVSGRTTSSKLARMLGEEETFALNYMEGQRLSVYTASMGKGLFLVLMVPKYVKQGAVWLYAKKAASEIEKLAERAMREVARTKKTGPLGPSREELRHELSAQAENVFGHELPSEERSPATPVQTLTFEEAMTQGLMGDMVNLMAQTAKVEPEQAQALPSLAEQPPTVPAETMSFEEAMKRGLLGDLGGLGQAPGAGQAAPEEPTPTEPVETMSFEEAMKRGLLGNLGPVESPPSEPPVPPSKEKKEPEKPKEFLTFEEMLERGLLGSTGSG